MKDFECVLCGEKQHGYGNNPAPLADKGMCCDKCNKKVLSERTRGYRQEQAILEVTDKLYLICEEFEMNVEFVQHTRSYIDEQIRIETGIKVSEL